MYQPGCRAFAIIKINTPVRVKTNQMFATRHIHPNKHEFFPEVMEALTITTNVSEGVKKQFCNFEPRYTVIYPKGHTQKIAPSSFVKSVKYFIAQNENMSID